MKDPFTPDKGRFLILGSRCSVCGRLVCVGPVGKPRRPAPPLPSCLGPHAPGGGSGDGVSASLSSPRGSSDPQSQVGPGAVLRSCPAH